MNFETDPRNTYLDGSYIILNLQNVSAISIYIPIIALVNY